MSPPIPACVALGERVATPLCSGSPRQTKPFIKRQSLMDFEARTVDFPRLQGSGPKFTHIPADKLKCHGKCIQFALKSMDSMAWGITVQRSCTRHRLNAGLAARFVCFHPWKGYKSHHRKRTLLLVGMESQHSPMTEITTRIHPCRQSIPTFKSPTRNSIITTIIMILTSIVVITCSYCIY